MKLGVLTFHDASNYGACLQAQATISAFEIFIDDVELIDYSNDFRRKIYSPKHKIIAAAKEKKIKQLIIYLIGYYGIVSRNKNFKRYRATYMKVSNLKANNSEQLEELSNEYDTIVAGSDQIWNLKNNGFDLNYLLKFSKPKHHTISFSSSMTSTDIPQNYKEEFFKLISKIRHVSVREGTAKDKIEQNIKNITIHETLDPVLLFGKDYWNSFVSKKLNIKNYTLVYVNDSKFFPNLDNNSKTVSIGSFRLNHIIKKNIKFYNNHGPSEFIYLIKNANLIYTTSFHGVILSLIYNKQFFVYLTGNDGRDSRIINLLQKFSLMDRAITLGNNNNSPKNNKIDYTEFNNKIQNLRDETLHFISQSLNS